ncbi:Ribosomal protein S3, C-terminal [Sesbania bispinosa]|nr:Ribosomal protein S3, C-terminal [Sesbania bispinosa]
MESGAKGCEVIVSGKLRAQRAKSMKFKDGYMISSGQPVKDYIDSAVRHVLLRQGVLGIKVKIMLDRDKGKQGPQTPLPDIVTIHAPKEEEEYTQPADVLSTDIEVSVA